MKYEFTVKLGSTAIKFYGEAESHKDFFEEAALYSGLPKKCGECESEDLLLEHRQPQGYDYYSVKCNKCGYNLPYGEYKEGDGAMFQKQWEAPYAKDEDDDAPKAKKSKGKGLGKKRAAPVEEEEDDEDDEVEAAPQEAPKSKKKSKPASKGAPGVSKLASVMDKYGLGK